MTFKLESMATQTVHGDRVASEELRLTIENIVGWSPVTGTFVFYGYLRYSTYISSLVMTGC